MGKDIEELMQCYDRFVDIVKQISMNANEQIVKLKGTIVADELAVSYTHLGKNISQVQVSPGGGRHGSNPYVKISTCLLYTSGIC